MTNRTEKVLSMALTLSAVAIALALVHREFASAGSISALPKHSAAGTAPVLNPKWEEFAAKGTRMGPESAAITILEFADFQCPACRTYQSTLAATQRQFGDKVALVFVHFPLPGHRFAEPAAHIANCAAMEGRFEAISKVLYAKQDSLGLKSWGSYAADAGIHDTLAIANCAKKVSPSDKVSAGKQLALQIGVRGTPTIIVNGWQFAYPPDEATLTNTIVALLAGHRPDDTVVR